MPGCRPRNALLYVENIRKALAKHDPANAETYARNAAAYAAQIKAVDEPLRQRLSAIPEGAALARLERGRLQLPRPRLRPARSSTCGRSTPTSRARRSRCKRVIDMVRKEKIPVVFSESTISDKPAKQVAKETGARYGGVLYVDSLSAENGPVPSYLKLLEVTVQTIAEGFGS